MSNAKIQIKVQPSYNTYRSRPNDILWSMDLRWVEIAQLDLNKLTTGA